MGRHTIEIQGLNGYKLDELIKLKNTLKSKYSRLVLTAVTMKYSGYSNIQICEATQLSNTTVISHIKQWNKYGIKSIKDHRGGSTLKLDAEIIDNLIAVAVNSSPNEFGFSRFTWTCALLAIYVKNNFGEEISAETIRRILKSNNLSFKRAQPKPTKADIEEQECFKKNVKSTTYFRIFL